MRSMKRHKSLGNLRRSLSMLYLRLSGTSLSLDKDFCKRHFKGPLLEEVEDSVRTRWSAVLNDPSVDIVVAQLSKFKDHPGLGISLEGTVDVLESGDEVRPHHYIRGVQPEGPVAADGTLREQDELLEVNGKKLHGLNHLEVVEILKALPSHVRIVCARRQRSGGGPDSPDTGSLDIDQMDDDDLMRMPRAALRGVDNNNHNNNSNNNKSRSFDDFSNTGFWSTNATVIELEKTPAGLGFSVLDYQDPLAENETVIIVRSLVPGGVAHKDGRLLPGDRLLFVNETNLERATLEETVRCLKSAPRGHIVIGVAKPSPLAASERKTSAADCRQLGGRHKKEEVQMATGRVTDAGCSFVRYPLGELLDVEAEIDDEEDELALMRPPRQVTFNCPEVKPPQLPNSLERRLRLTTDGFLELGLIVDSVDGGVNGCVIRRVVNGGLAHADGTLQPGDLLTAVNSDSLRRMTTAEARDRIKMAGLLTRDICIRYISASDAALHLASLNPTKPGAETDWRRNQECGYYASAADSSDLLDYAIVHHSSEEDAATKRANSSTPIRFADEEDFAASPAEVEALGTTTTMEEPQAEAEVPATAVPRSRPGIIREKSLSLDGSPASGNASSWSEPRTVRLWRDENRSLGVSIVGGRVAGHGLHQSVSGVFIKQVAEPAPGRREGVMRTGDRILAVCGQDLTLATHDEAVNLIRNAPSPVEFCVQSLVNPSCPNDADLASSSRKQQPTTPEPDQVVEVPAWQEAAGVSALQPYVRLDIDVAARRVRES